MNSSNTQKSRAEFLFNDLCDEIDALQVALLKAKETEKYWKEEYAKLLSCCKEDQERTIGQLLTYALTMPEHPGWVGQRGGMKVSGKCPV